VKWNELDIYEEVRRSGDCFLLVGFMNSILPEKNFASVPFSQFVLWHWLNIGSQHAVDISSTLCPRN